MKRRNMFACFCFLQAIIVISLVLYSLALMDHNKGNQLQKEPTEKVPIVTTDATKEEIRRTVLRGIKKSVEGLDFTLFPYHLLREIDTYVEPEQKVNDEGEYSYFAKNDTYMEEDIPIWFEHKHDYCSGCFVVYGTGAQVISLKDVTIVPNLGHGKKGGEDIEDVINQKEDEEVITIEQGYFVVDTQKSVSVTENLAGDLNKFYKGMLTKDSTFVPYHQRKRPDMTGIIIVRHEYANFYHTTMTWYDIFLVMVLFKITPYQVEVLWLDAHPSSKIDDAWEILFGRPVRAGGLTHMIKYSNMIWTGFGPKGQINQHKSDFLPFGEAYRHFVLTRFEINDEYVMNCKQIRITIIWRRNHVSHPRNPGGHVARKIANEEEVWKAAKEADPMAIVNGVQLDRLGMDEQLELISRTDILIGMHGAGLTHILYLPKTAGVIEFFPSYMSPGNSHFRAMARWRRIKYIVWQNTDESRERKDHSTTIPITVVKGTIRTMKEHICN
ncbi:hypothetical protein DPMN_008932 [Dreissena polymorpha]|uniref:EGF domain-specific O-linked N-acetylglucosamine transferase n=2 Tax=Dreissena polymorpha TaxID=45954 RepID=A0A9D4MYQ0_DREPO|nr:hypothetical protein DPMN_008932 [Dreissena polymorpha]